MLCFAAPIQASETLSLSLEAPSLGDVPKPAPKAAPEQQPKTVEVKVGRVGVLQVPSSPIYVSKSSSAAKYTTAKADTSLAIVKEEGEWYGVLMANGAIGWVPRANVKMTGYDIMAKKPEAPRGTVTSRGGEASRPTVLPDGVIRTALEYSGVRYVFGGTNPATGMDCSAFVRAVFSRHGQSLPRTAREQALVGATVPFDQLQPGDRLYFSCKNSYIDHCGIYAGNGYFIHCSAGRNGVDFDSLSSDFYWRSLIVAKR